MSDTGSLLPELPHRLSTLKCTVGLTSRIKLAAPGSVRYSHPVRSMCVGISMAFSLSKLVATHLSLLLQYPTADDSLIECPTPILAILSTHPESLIRLARSKLYSWPYAEVPACWRRLFVDSSIVHAIQLIQGKLLALNQDSLASHDNYSQNGKSVGAMEKFMDATESIGQDDWLQSVVKLLDMAIIMAGGEGRRDMIDTILQALQQDLETHVDSVTKGSEPKRRKLESAPPQYSDRFPIQSGNSRVDRPQLRYPVQSSLAPSVMAFEQHLRAGKGPLVMARVA